MRSEQSEYVPNELPAGQPQAEGDLSGLHSDLLDGNGMRTHNNEVYIKEAVTAMRGNC